MLPTKAIFLRHGNSAAADNPNMDPFRQLTRKGRERACTQAKRLSALPLTSFSISSSADRACQTARIVGGATKGIFRSDLLYFPQNEIDRKFSDKAFGELRYSPLSKYLLQDYAGWMLRHGLQAIAEISSIYEKHLGDDPSDAAYLLITGHAVTLPLVALLMYPEHCKEILEVNMGQADALVITPDSFEHMKAE